MLKFLATYIYYCKYWWQDSALSTTHLITSILNSNSTSHRINKDSYEKWLTRGTIVEKDGYGIKVVRLDDGQYLKLFRLKRRFSSARWYSYAKRFTDNAAQLSKRGIVTLSGVEYLEIPHIERSCVLYEPVEGESFRQLAKQGKLTRELSQRYFELIAELHRRGIYFRSLHLGNIILTPTGELALIDIADIRFKNKPLNLWQRRRNFAHLFRYQEDIEVLLPEGKNDALQAYLDNSNLSGRQQRKLQHKLLSLIP